MGRDGQCFRGQIVAREPRGLTLAGFYTYGQNFDNSDGAFVNPSTIFLADQWGPAAFDRRHNWRITFNTNVSF